jgi:multifunctional methyltransferase subunit TRM112
LNEYLVYFAFFYKKTKPFEATKMKLLTHNMLCCHSKTCKNGFPLALKEIELEQVEVDFNQEFIKKMIYKIDFDALNITVQSLGLSKETLTSESNLEVIHDLLLQRVIKNGIMTCPECNHDFVVSNYIPNMLLDEEKV